MTANRRIFLNIIATYGRSLYALVIGLFCGRWTLMALGEIDYGLMNVVGGLIVFVTFMNGLLASSVGRFYAFTFGQLALTNKEAMLDEIRRWFSLAVTLHLIVPCCLMLVGYPVGVWLVRSFLEIPPDKLQDCVWVFRFACISSFVSMLTVPFNAMYVAKQYIAELTLYSLASATLNVVFLYYMILHPGVWLVKYALFTCVLAVLPSLVIAIRGCLLFPECRYEWRYWWSRDRVKQLLGYCSWTILGGIGMVFRNQGMAVLVNKFFPPPASANASIALATTINGHTMTLMGAIQGAMTPVITTAVGAGNFSLAQTLAFRFCKLAMIFSLIFIIPLFIELPQVLHLWLGNPPKDVVKLSRIMLIMAFIDTQTLGHGIATMAYGEIKWYQIVLGGFNLLALPLAYLFCKMGKGVDYVALAALIAWAFLAYGRLYFAKKFLGMGVMYWFQDILMPIILAVLATIMTVVPVLLFLDDGVCRLLITIGIVELVFLPLCWFFSLDCEERHYVKSRIVKIRQRYGQA